MKITYSTLCSGIESASVAIDPLGWQALWFSEIDPFPAAVLAHRFPAVPNIGDMTRIRSFMEIDELPLPDVCIAGTPCQDFSVAGLRAGMEGSRGNLTLEYVRIANETDRLRRDRGEQPTIWVWENVPGVLSDASNAFGSILAALAGDEKALQPGDKPEPGRSTQHWTWDKKRSDHRPKWPLSGCVFGPQRAIAWRVLDAQYFGVAQRRRRVLLVASARDDINPAEILFEFDGVRRDIAPSREAGQVTSALTANGVGTCGADDNQAQAGHLRPVVCMAHGQGGAEIAEDRSPTPTCNHEAPIAAYSSNGVGSWKRGFGPLRAREQDSHDNLAVTVVHGTQDPCVGDNLAFTLGRNNGAENAVAYSVALRGREGGATAELGGDIAGCLRASSGGGDKPHVLAPFAFVQNSRDEIRLMGGDGKIGGALSAQPGMKQQCFVAQCVTGDITHTLKADGFDGSEDGTGRGQPIVPVVFGIPGNWIGRKPENGGNAVEPMRNVAPCLTSADRHGVAHGMAVRRLTPVECARLQGFQDDHCNIPWKGKEAPDGPQYKAYGNSKAVPKIRWLARRIEKAIRKAGAIEEGTL